MKKKLSAAIPLILILSGCAKSNDPAPTSSPVVEQRDDSPNAKELPLCSREEKTYVKLDVHPGYRYRLGEIKRLIEKSGPSMKKQYLSLSGDEVAYTRQEALLNAWKKTEGDINCVRYQPQRTTNGKPDGAADCLVYSCTFTERETAEVQQPIDPNLRTTVTGAKYIRDFSHSKLGEAYRDPSGLIWGDVVSDQAGKWIKLRQEAAEDYCKKLNARLPTETETFRLATDFGYDNTFRNPKSYQPFQRGTKDTVLPNWPDSFNSFWASTNRVSDGKRLYCRYYSDSGAVTWSANGDVGTFPTFTRCVAQTK